jgi:arsenate reductase
MNILFVCKGNVGRSQIAEALFVELSPEEHAVSSAGTDVSAEGQKLGDFEPAQVVIDSLKEIGVEVSQKARNQLTPEMVEHADRIIVMTQENIPEYLRDNPKAIPWEVEDPQGGSLETLRETRKKITQLVLRLIKDVREESHREVTGERTKQNR